MALGLYLMLAVAEVGYVHVTGLLAGHGDSVTVSATVRDGSIGGLLVYAWFTWRMWLGGAISWTLSLLWKLLTVVATAFAWHEAGGPVLAGLLALTIARAAPPFAPAVLDRVTRASENARGPSSQDRAQRELTRRMAGLAR